MTARRTAAALTGLLALPGAAVGQDVANNTTFGDWVVNCEAVTTRQTTCRLVQSLTRSEDNSLVVRFIGVPGEGDTTVLLAQVPMGVYLPGGAVFRPEGADDADQTEMIWQRCLGQICEAAVGLSPEDLEAFTAAGSILFGYRMDLSEEPIIVRADVSRFAEAMAVIDEEEAEEAGETGAAEPDDGGE